MILEHYLSGSDGFGKILLRMWRLLKHMMMLCQLYHRDLISIDFLCYERCHQKLLKPHHTLWNKKKKDNQIRLYKLLTQQDYDLMNYRWHNLFLAPFKIFFASAEACTRRKKRCPYSKQQIRELEREFLFNIYINKDRRTQLSHLLRLTDRWVNTSLNQFQCDNVKQCTALQTNLNMNFSCRAQFFLDFTSGLHN